MVCTHNVRSFAVTLDLARQTAKDWARLAERKKAKEQKKQNSKKKPPMLPSAASFIRERVLR
jgi:hypothetical protein